MHTLRLTSSPSDIARAGRLLQADEIVIFPTETVYGLGALADSSIAVAKVYQAKHRPADNPLIVHVQDLSMASLYARELRDIECYLFEALSPGPLTIVTNRRPERAAAAAAGNDTIALRIPESTIAQELIIEVGTGIAAPSANASGRPSPTNFEMAWHEMSGRVAGIIIGPQCKWGLESTILCCKKDNIFILRSGAISLTTICELLRKGGFQHTVNTTLSGPPAPGRKYRHYSPNSPVRLYRTADELRALLSKTRSLSNALIRILVPGKNFHRIPHLADEVFRIRELTELFQVNSPTQIQMIELGSLEEYAKRLYTFFHQIDVEVSREAEILAYLPPKSLSSLAILDRLQRASATYHSTEGTLRSSDM